MHNNPKDENIIRRNDFVDKMTCKSNLLSFNLQSKNLSNNNHINNKTMKHFTLSVLSGTLLAMMALSMLPSNVQAKASPRLMEEISQDSLIKLKKDTLSTLVSQANTLLSSGIGSGISVDLNDDVTNFGDLVNESDVTLAALNEAIAKFRKDIEVVKSAAVYYNKFSAALTELSELETKYPNLKDKGGAALESEYNRLETILSGDQSTVSDYINGYKAAKAAKIAYLLSGGYSAANPADLTCLINYPNMRKSSTDPSDNTGFTDELIYSADTLLGGWKYTIPNGKYVANRYMRGMTCMQFWAGAPNTIDLHQEITDLPNGLYTVSAMFNTTTGRENDQHTYGTSGGATSVSPNIPVDGLWPVDGSDDAIVANDWDTLTTDKVLVSDGTLIIGAASNVIEGDGGIGDKGWFCITGFKLKYYGSDTSELVKDLAAKQTAATAMADTMKLKGDKAALLKAIEASKEASLTTDAALAIINAGISQATISNDKYNTFVGSTVPSYMNQVDTTVADNKAMMETVQAAINSKLAADTANYKMLTAMKAMLSNYATQITLISTSKTAYTQYSTSKYYADFMTVLNNQIAAMKADALSAETLTQYAAVINDYVKAMQLENVMSNPGENDDMTFLITNPTTTNSDNAAVPEGWTINKGVGNVYTDTKKIDATVNHAVFLSWNGAAGTVLYNATQTLKNIPNGTYRLEAIFGNTNSYDPTTLATGICLTAKTTDGGLMVKEHSKKFKKEFFKEFFPTLYHEDGTEVANEEAYGTVWAKSLRAYNSGTYTKQDSLNIFGGAAIAPEASHDKDIFDNPNDVTAGYGWYTEAIENIVVKDHQLTIGCSTDSTVTGHKFIGNWFEVTNFKLYYTAAGNNDDYLLLGVSNAQAEQPMKIYSENGRIVVNGAKQYSVYDITGKTVNKNEGLAKGIYIVRSGKQAKKIMVK